MKKKFENKAARKSGVSSGTAEFLGLAVVLALAAILRLWNLPQNGYGNLYYAATVRSMLQSWHNFFFASFDPLGYVSVDKPPLALWLQAASAWALGYSPFSLLLPQALEGVASVFVVFRLARSHFRAPAALLAALAMALSPVCVATDRFNNVDSCLVLVLLLAAWALDAGLRSNRKGLWLLALGLVGLGFNTKMGAAFLVLPAFYLYFWLEAGEFLKRRLAWLCLGSLVLAGVALSWPLAVDFTPPEQRPWVGSTQDNSMLSLSLGWNGFQRLVRRGRFDREAGGAPISLTDQAQALSGSAQSLSISAQALARMARRRGGGFMGAGQPGLLRLAEAQMAGQVGWLFPLVLLGFLAGWFQKGAGRAPGVSRHALVFWGLWMITCALVFSFMRGIIHPYYLVLLAPPFAVLSGAGTVALWDDFRRPGSRRLLLPLALVLTLAWQAFILSRYPGWLSIGLPLPLAAGLLACLVLAALPRLKPRSAPVKRWTIMGFALASFSLLACPLVWSLTPVMAASPSPEAGPGVLDSGPRGRAPGASGDAATQRLLSFLQNHPLGRGVLVAALNSQLVAPIIIRTGQPALALGGFMGADPILTTAELARMVEQGLISRVLVPAEAPRDQNQGVFGQAGPRPQNGPWGTGGPNNPNNALALWVRQHGKRVDPALWKPSGVKEEVPAWFEGAATGNAQKNPGVFLGRRGLASLDLYELSPGEAGGDAPAERRRHRLSRGRRHLPVVREETNMDE